MEALTNEQLCALAQAGDEQAVSRLIEANLHFIRQTANQIIGSPIRKSYLYSCGIETDDLIQAGSIGLWKATAGYDLSSKNKFLTYAAPAIKRAMIDLIRQYSQDKNASGEIVSLNDVHNDAIRNLMILPSETQPEQIYIEQETVEGLYEAMDALPDRECVYVQYRFGFVDGKDHPLTETAQYFHLTESRAKGVERSALKLLRHKLLIEIPKQAYAKAEDRLTKVLVAAGELHAVELHLKSQKKWGKKITTAVYEYLSDCDGTWGELYYDFKDGTAEIVLLAEWDTIVSHQFAMRAVEHLQRAPISKLPEKFMLTFIGPEQLPVRATNCRLRTVCHKYAEIE
ncbi:sigma-70 family RNA polymerase sigma factor [Ligaoa zhengdingensis]|uniref:sigma-70 family RNA polymerase sigma factor n=1 Tax=Ligaoa zhengdingensis TaxID=2763658 RepID=UPI0031BBB43E